MDRPDCAAGSAHPSGLAQPTSPCLVSAAEDAGLIYTTDTSPGIRRRRSGRGFAYRGPDGAPVTDKKTLERIRRLVLPPAWTAIWICTRPNGHLQATGRDERGRKQYRYHDGWRAARDSTKFDRLADFAEQLPSLRTAVEEHLALRGLPREKVLATVVTLLERTLIRIGNAEYARQNGSYGLTTLRDAHVTFDGSEIKFRFRGKSSKLWTLSARDRRIARIVRSCQELPGQHLFQYLETDGSQQAVTSGDINRYLQEIGGTDITAKDFRTWAGTVQAALELSRAEAPDNASVAKRVVKAALDRVAARLGNTVAICRKCYVHPAVFDCYFDGTLAAELKLDRAVMVEKFAPAEAAVHAWLARRAAYRD